LEISFADGRRPKAAVDSSVKRNTSSKPEFDLSAKL
jgi:hypothetical protein